MPYHLRIIDSFYNNLIAEDRYRMILDGLQVTLLITLGAIILGTILGGVVCWMRMSRRGWLQKTAKVYIDIMRGTPVLVILMLMYYVVMAPLEATGIVVAVITFGMNAAAYISEMLRTAIQGIDRGQTEAGLALGYTPTQAFVRIVLPQVVRSVLPVYQGEVVSLLKGTSIVGYIAVTDMTRASDLIRSRTFDAFFPLIVTALIYFFMAWLIGRLLTALQNKEYRKAVAAAALLIVGGTLCYIPRLASHSNEEVQEEVPAVFRALNGKRVGVALGSIQDIAVTKLAPGADIQRISGVANMLMALESRKVDVIGYGSLAVSFDKHLAAKVDTVEAGYPPIFLGACFRLGNTELQQDFNSFLADARKDGTYQDICNRWREADDASAVPLPTQRGTGKTLRVAVAPETAPFDFISSGVPSGLEIDLLTEWANRRGWKLEFLSMDFAALLPSIQTGKADVAIGVITATEERKKQVLFSDGYLESYMVFMTRKGEIGRLTGSGDSSSDNQTQRKFAPWGMAVLLLLVVGIGLWLYFRRRSGLPNAASAPGSSDEPIIRFSHMQKSYGDLQVLKDINADIHCGEVVSIIGPSGTGKSTLLRCLNLLDSPTGGRIYVDGENILAKAYPVHKMRQKMGMVFQSFNLFPHKTVLENITMAPCDLLHIPEEKAREEGLALLRKVGLAEKADVYPSSLSGGQKQRVAIARALAMKPEVILFDEPTSALDPTMVGEVLSVIRQLAGEGLTMLIVTHEMKFAHDVSTRIFFMSGGYIHEDGSPRQIFEAPVHSATKAFIQRIRKEVFEITGPDYDYLGMYSQMGAFCHKYNIDGKLDDAKRLCGTVLTDVMADCRPLVVRITHSEMSGVTTLDFMVRNLQATPLSPVQRNRLSGLCRQVVEEPTALGFRVRLII